MIDAPPTLCWFCGAGRGYNPRGLCARCYEASRASWIVCLNCDKEAPNRGRGLCGRCYQYVRRTGRLPEPNLTTPEEVLGE